jgi:glucoamylase
MTTGKGTVMLNYALVRPAVHQSDLAGLTPYLLTLMMRNVASDGFAFTDPADPQQFSAPGCIIASPSYAADQAAVTQDYVYNWTRDAAVTAAELAQASLPAPDGGGTGPLDDYVSFAATCQQAAPGLDTAVYTIEGQPRLGWSLQNDGPALQALAIFQAFGQLSPAAQDTARGVAQRDLQFIVDRHADPATNLWEEVVGQSFFTRAVQLRCLTQAQGNAFGITVPLGAGDAIAWLGGALAGHWNGQYYASILDAQNPRWGYDPNIDIVMASVSGAVDCADPQLLATAALLREQWADPGSVTRYPINLADATQGLGPMLGRYPGDSYDGDQNVPAQGHPWALATANFAELYYRVAARVQQTGQVPASPLAADYLGQVGIGTGTPAPDAAARLRAAGDQMLQAIVYHSDHLELSEQFDAATGYEKSVRDLTWSYAAFLSAMRARAAVAT